MTRSEKAVETRKQRIETQKVRNRERKEIREKAKKSCLQVLDDPSASTADKLTALEILHDLGEWW